MVLSNKKLKQKLRTQLAESLSKSDSQLTQDSQTNQSFKSILNSITQKPNLSKREIRRVKTPFLEKSLDLENGGVKENKKRKREKDDDKGKDVITKENEGKDLSEKKSGKKKNKKKKNKKKKVVKKEEEIVKKENDGNDEQGVVVVEPVRTEVTQISKEDESVSTKVYVGGIPYYSTVDDIRSFFEGCGSITEIDCLKFPETGKFNGIAMISFRTEAAAKRALGLDGSDMGGLLLKVQPYKAHREKKVTDFAPAMLDGYNRIYVGNLSWDMTEDELKKFFSDCSISSVRLGKDKETGEFKGFAHVDFADSLSLTMALKLDQKPLFGRPVRVRCAVPAKSANPSSNSDTVVSIKDDNVKLPSLGASGDAEANDDMARNAKRQTCYECGEKGHISSSCPNKKSADMIYTGYKTDDVAFYNDKDETDNFDDAKLKRRTCYECGEKGHLSSACPNKKAADVAYTSYKTDDVAFYNDKEEADNIGDGKLKRRTCYECGEKGHLSSLCPNKKASDVAYTSYKNDDVAFYNDKDETDNFDDAKLKRMTCYECGEKGHLSSLCPNKKSVDVAYTGYKTDYVAFDKYKEEAEDIGDGKLKRRTCYECGEKGHLSSSCPKKQTVDNTYSGRETFASVTVAKNEEVDYNMVNSVSDGKVRRRTCYECGERGHLSSLCPKKPAADMANVMEVKKVVEINTMAAVDNDPTSVSEGKLRRRTCYECGERGHLSSLCPKKQTADMAITKKEADYMEVEKVEVVKSTMVVSDGKLKRRNCYECGLKGHLSSLCPNKKETGLTA